MQRRNKMLKLTGNKITMDFDEEHGVVHSICKNGLETIGEKVPVFMIILQTDAGINIPVESMDMSFKGLEENENSFACMYEDCGLKVKISAQIDSDISWDISIDVPDGYTVKKTDFPRINLI